MEKLFAWDEMKISIWSCKENQFCTLLLLHISLLTIYVTVTYNTVARLFFRSFPFTKNVCSLEFFSSFSLLIWMTSEQLFGVLIPQDTGTMLAMNSFLWMISHALINMETETYWSLTNLGRFPPCCNCRTHGWDIFESATNEMLNVTPNKLNLYLLYGVYSMVARKKN